MPHGSSFPAFARAWVSIEVNCLCGGQDCSLLLLFGSSKFEGDCVGFKGLCEQGLVVPQDLFVGSSEFFADVPFALLYIRCNEIK